MIEGLLTAFTLSIITLGFAGMLGELIFQLRTGLKLPLAFLSLLIISLVFFPPLSLPASLQWTLWASALGVATIFAIRPVSMPEFLLSRRFILRYACLAMLFSAMWYLAAGQSFLMTFLAIFAVLAALSSWRESLQW